VLIFYLYCDSLGVCTIVENGNPVENCSACQPVLPKFNCANDACVLNENGQFANLAVCAAACMKDCVAANMVFNACTYAVPALKHKESRYIFAPNGFTGGTTATCTNGVVTIAGSTCAQNCAATTIDQAPGCKYTVGAQISGDPPINVNNFVAGYVGRITVACNNGQRNVTNIIACAEEPCAAIDHTVGNCTYTIPPLNSGVTTQPINTSTAGYDGTITATCNKGQITYGPATCVEKPCPANSTYTVGNCVYNVRAMSAGEQIQVTSTSAAYTGKITVRCYQGTITHTPQPQDEPCIRKPCVLENTKAGQCDFNLAGTTIAYGTNTTYQRTTTVNGVNYAGSVRVYCGDNGVATYDSYTCAVASCTLESQVRGNCTYVFNPNVLAIGQSTTTTPFGFQYTGRMYAMCQVDGSVQYQETESCTPKSCAITAYTQNNCTWNFPVTTIPHNSGTQSLAPTNSGYEGTATATCSFGNTTYSITGCTPKSCTIPAGYTATLGACTFTWPAGLISHGVTTPAISNTNSSTAQGTATLTCNAGTLTPTLGTCVLLPCQLPATHSAGGCTYPLGGGLAVDQTKLANTSTIGGVGTVSARCNSGGSITYTYPVRCGTVNVPRCTTTSIATTRTSLGGCTYNFSSAVSLKSNETLAPINNTNTTTHTGQSGLLCYNGILTLQNETCARKCVLEPQQNGNCYYPFSGSILSTAGNNSVEVQTNTPNYAGRMKAECASTGTPTYSVVTPCTAIPACTLTNQTTAGGCSYTFAGITLPYNGTPVVREFTQSSTVTPGVTNITRIGKMTATCTGTNGTPTYTEDYCRAPVNCTLTTQIRGNCKYDFPSALLPQTTLTAGNEIGVQGENATAGTNSYTGFMIARCPGADLNGTPTYEQTEACRQIANCSQSPREAAIASPYNHDSAGRIKMGFDCIYNFSTFTTKPMNHGAVVTAPYNNNGTAIAACTDGVIDFVEIGTCKTPCSGYAYGLGPCTNNQKQVTTYTKTPAGCVGEPEELPNLSPRACTSCTGYTYDAATICVGGFQRRTVSGYLPNGCEFVAGVSPPFGPDTNTGLPCPCTSYVYTYLPLCINGLAQVNTAVGIPSGCAGGVTPATTGPCSVPNPIQDGVIRWNFPDNASVIRQDGRGPDVPANARLQAGRCYAISSMGTMQFNPNPISHPPRSILNVVEIKILNKVIFSGGVWANSWYPYGNQLFDIEDCGPSYARGKSFHTMPSNAVLTLRVVDTTYSDNIVNAQPVSVWFTEVQ
jgi:hypothetical protein